MNKVYEDALQQHKKYKGKLKEVVNMPCDSMEELSLAYTPGVAAPCLEIAKNYNDVYEYTGKGNTVAIVTDGSAVLGLGNIGAAAGLPVMEGKALLMNKFAGINAFPLCINTQDTQEIIKFCKLIEPTVGGINLEDISAPRCVEIERTLINEMNIPVFHDDQHGTAIVVLAGLINSLKLIGKTAKECKVVINGTGAAGSSIIAMLYHYGFENIIAFDKDGCLMQGDKDKYDSLKQELLNYVNKDNVEYKTLADGLKGADIFVGVSVGNIVSKEMVESMAEKNVVMAMANPEPEIGYDNAKQAGAYIVGTGRGDRPNQVNNLLAFPSLFRGALDAHATKITQDVKIACSYAIASLVDDSMLSTDCILPNVMDPRLVDVVSKAVKQACIDSGNVRK